jgi:AcrR family transcriptional regulator
LKEGEEKGGCAINTRKLILEATERIIRLKGLARATTKEIAREAGCSEGTLYKHFEHKEDLFLTLVQDHLPTVIEVLAEAEADQPMHAKLETIAYAAITFYQQVIPLASSFFADNVLLVRFQQVVSRGQGGPQRFNERVAASIKEEQEHGHLNPDLDPLSVAALLLGACFQYVFFLHFLGSNPPQESERIFVSRLVQTLMSGVPVLEQ